jgi:hypothetical protein
VLARADAKLASLSADEDDGEETGIDPEMMRNIYLSELDLAAVGAELMSQDGKVLTMDDYTSYIDKLVEAYPDRTRAEIEADHGVEAFAISEYADYLAQVIDGYVAGIFKKVLAK